MQILGVKISEINLEQARQLAREFLNSNEQRKIFTPNPEMIVRAQKDKYFKKVLNNGDLNLCDGFGLALFSGASRITGVDFMLDICKIAEEMGKSVFLLGSGSDDVIKKTTDELKKMFPNINIAGYDKGPDIRENDQASITNGQSMNNLIEQINLTQPDIIFIAFGMGKQEKWIYENLAKITSVKIAMGVGGAFDYISYNIKRAPCRMRKIGLEWVYRLIKQPRRFFRIFNAVVVFSVLFIKEKIKF